MKVFVLNRVRVWRPSCYHNSKERKKERETDKDHPFESWVIVEYKLLLSYPFVWTVINATCLLCKLMPGLSHCHVLKMFWSWKVYSMLLFACLIQLYALYIRGHPKCHPQGICTTTFTNHPPHPRAISVGIKCGLWTGYKTPCRCKMRTRNYKLSVKHRPGIKCGLVQTVCIKTVLKR